MASLFQILHRDSQTKARCCVLNTAHGKVSTPVFIPVGTGATVKGVPQGVLEQLDTSIILSNTYHLYLRPGKDVIQAHGGLHDFMSWPRPLLTDSGGYQVFSHRALRKISEDGVEFRSHLDGSSHFLSPEKSIQLQEVFGADIIMAFDDCTPYPVGAAEARKSMLRSIRWAKRCKATHRREEQILFGIAQGGIFWKLRRESLQRLAEIDFPGLALGGLSVGEPKLEMYELIERSKDHMQEDKPRYVMGVGTPLDLLHCVNQGMDMFDCVLPTRNARNGTLITSRGPIRIKNARYRFDQDPLDPDCKCCVCQRYTRSYLRHLYISGEILSSVLNTLHNLSFYLDFMRRVRNSISHNSFSSFEQRFRRQYVEFENV